MSGAVRVGVDVGGTFTDVVLVVDGAVTTAKVPTTDDQSDGVLAGIERACERAGVDPDSVEQFRHAMTVATNAMLEGDTAQTALVTTEGFGDVLAIGRQDRPALYDLTASKPDPLVSPDRRHELTERATPERIETEPRDVDRVVEAIDDSTESVAVCLLHAYAHPENERRVAEHIRENRDCVVVASHETLPEFREYERTATTVVDAAVTPVIEGYLDRLVDRVRDRGVPEPGIMQSNGGVAPVSTVRAGAATTVLSGPAAGVVGATLFEDESDDGVVTVDMGGTSTDVGLVRGGDIERTTTATVGGHPVHLPMVDIETVGAGGGSVARVDAGGALRVGPRSAGARPGPVCYGRGGEAPTVTDAALVCGYLGPETTLGEGLELDADAAETALADLASEAGLAGPVEAARGVYRVANAAMTRAIRRVTLERGHDPRRFALVAFGGAGPMHAAALADRLGVETVRVPRASGVLSALGLLAADERHDASRTDHTTLDGAQRASLGEQYETLTERALAETTDPGRATVTRRADLRYEGQSHELSVDVETADPDALAERFHATHERIRGYRLDDPVELVTLRVTVAVPDTRPDISHEGSTDAPTGYRPVSFESEFRETPVYDHGRLPAGTTIDGPVVVEGGESTVVVPPAWRVRVDDSGTLTLEVTG